MSAETKNFIEGKWVATGSTFDSVNPATGELVSRCAEASQQELDAAVAAACDAFPAWRKTPLPRRAEILFRVADLPLLRRPRWAFCFCG
jgi:acyl-CoA reductase-like NAD-dependent aldehyde dehydrogenase